MNTINKNKNELRQILTAIQNLPNKNNTQINLQEITITPTTEIQTITPSFGYGGFSKIIVEAITAGSGGLPTFTYTGEFQIVEEDDVNWQIKLKTTGNLTFTNLGNAINGLDVFCVGGGGAGGGYGGGGGGFTTTANYFPRINDTYSMYIGDGATTSDERGGITSAFNGTIQAEGGYTSTYSPTPDNSRGGDGGSGGGGSGDNIDGARQTFGGNGGSDGGNGGDGGYTDKDGNTKSAYTGGRGQGPTTRAFSESDGELYSGGGGGNCNGGQSFEGSGGDGGGGDVGQNGIKNTGGGGGGSGGFGGSGIIIIRNRR